MRQRSVLLGDLATYRELPAQEQEQLAARSAEVRDILEVYRAQDALLAALPEPPIPARTTARIWAATVGASPAIRRRPLGIPHQPLSLRAWTAVAAILVLVACLGVTSYTTAASLPGDPLYAAKRLEERVQLGLTLDSAQREAYEQRLEERRRAEVRTLLDRRRAGVAITFTGDLEQAPDGRLSVAGLPVTLPDEQAAPVGAWVAIEGITGEGQVQVRALTVRSRAGPPMPMRPQPGAGPHLTSTPDPSATPTATARTPEPTVESQPTGSPQPPTATPRGPHATAQSTGGPQPTTASPGGPRATAQPTGGPQPTASPGGPHATAQPTGGPQPTTDSPGGPRATAQPTGGPQPTTDSPGGPRATAQPTGGPQPTTDSPGGPHATAQPTSGPQPTTATPAGPHATAQPTSLPTKGSQPGPGPQHTNTPPGGPSQRP